MPTPPKDLQEVYKLKSNDCSGFLKEAGRVLELPPGLVPDKNADGIIDSISNGSGGWINLGQGSGVAGQAIAAAKQGYLVVALLKAADHLPFRLNRKTGKYDIPHPYSHGHVAIVLPYFGRESYPLVVCGSIAVDGKSPGDKAVRGVWRGVDAPNVSYYRSPGVVPKLKAAYQ